MNRRKNRRKRPLLGRQRAIARIGRGAPGAVADPPKFALFVIFGSFLRPHGLKHGAFNSWRCVDPICAIRHPKRTKDGRLLTGERLGRLAGFGGTFWALKEENSEQVDFAAQPENFSGSSELLGLTALRNGEDITGNGQIYAENRPKAATKGTTTAGHQPRGTHSRAQGGPTTRDRFFKYRFLVEIGCAIVFYVTVRLENREDFAENDLLSPTNRPRPTFI